MGNVILVTSSKNDIGQTIIGIKTGIELSKKDKKVLLVDLSCGKRKISDYFNESEDIIYDVKDVMDDICSAQQATISINENLYIIPYPRMTNKLRDIKKEGFEKLINEINNAYDVVIIDIDSLSQGFYINFEDIYGVFIVDNNDYSSIKNINSAYEIAKKFGVERIKVIINKYNKKGASNGTMLDIKDFNKMLTTPITCIIEENNKYMNINLGFINNDEKNSLNYAIENLLKP